jgi:hypothetical protein
MALTKTQFAEVARQRMKEADEFWHNWRACAVDDYAFISGSQWLAADEALLNEQGRPPITFNYSEKMIDAVVGAEVSNRQEMTFKPRGVEDAALSELWNNAAAWVRDECNAEDEESDAFRDMLICGMGWTTTRISYDEDQDGKILVERIDPLEMRSDPAANKPGLTDRRYAYRKWWVDEREAKREWPSEMAFPESDADNTSRGVITRGRRYQDGEADDQERHKDQVEITLYECVEREPIYRVEIDGELREISNADFNAMKASFDEANVAYVKQYKRVYYRGFFAGESLLEFGPSPVQTGFTFQAITGKRDHNRNTWYGLTRVMKDPQRWANKWLSQILHIINTNAKGGLLAEIGSFVDPTKAQEEWAKPDSVTLLTQGSMNKVQQKQQAPYPSGLDKLMEFALGSLPMVTGINLEALGLANREQAGVLEAQRKQAAYGLLAPVFDALRRYRKNQGRVLLAFIHQFISDGRLVRIGGPESQQFLPLTKQKDAPRYDIIVDQSPTAPDVKQRTWETLTTLVPSMLKAGMPLPPDLLDYSPLPAALAAKWKAFAAQQQQPDPRMQQMMQQMQQLAQENAALKADKSEEQQQLRMKAQQIEAELMLKKQSQDAEMALDREKASAEFELEKFKQDREFELERRRIEHEANLRKATAEGDFKIKAFTAGIKANESGKLEIDTGGFAEVMQQFSETNARLLADNANITGAAEQTNERMLATINHLIETFNKPRKLVTDATGKPIGSEVVDKLPSTS